MYGLIVLIVYFALMMGATLIFTKKEMDSKSFYVSDRKMGTIRSAMSIAATWIWAPALFVSAEKAYNNGIPGLFWFVVPNILCLIAFVPFAKKIRKEMPKGITISGYMGEKYNSKKVKNVYLFQLISLIVLSTGVQLLAGGKILSNITGIPFIWITIILAAIAYSYSQFSGIQASVMTDTLQMILILVACVIFVPWALKSGDGVSNLMKGLSGRTGEYNSFFSGKGLELFFAFGLPTAIGLISGPFGDQCFWQRAFSIKEEKIGRAFLVGSIIFAIVPISMGVLGFIAAGSGFQAIDSGVVNFELITHLFPKWAMIPFLFMLISGLLSTVDSNLCAMASLTTDIVKEDSLKISKLSMIVLLAIGIFIANIPGLTITHLFLIYGTLRASTLLPTVMTLNGVKLSSKGIYLGILLALAIGLPLFAYGTILNISAYKTIGSISTVLSAGIVALIVSRLEADRI